MKALGIVAAIALLITGCVSRTGNEEQLKTLTQALNEGQWQACIKLHAAYAAFADGAIVAVRGGASLSECMGAQQTQAPIVIQIQQSTPSTVEIIHPDAQGRP